MTLIMSLARSVIIKKPVYDDELNRVGGCISQNQLTVQGCSQNFKKVLENFTEVFNVDDVTVYDLIRRNQHPRKENVIP